MLLPGGPLGMSTPETLPQPMIAVVESAKSRRPLRDPFDIGGHAHPIPVLLRTRLHTTTMARVNSG